MAFNSVNTLFSSLGNNANSGVYNSLSELASIRSGSFRKLAEKYYSDDTVKESRPKRVSSMDYDYKRRDYVKNLENKDIKKEPQTPSISTAKDKPSELATIEKAAEFLQTSAENLSKKGTKSVFAEKEDGSFDVDKITDAVKDFVKNYNSLIDASKSTKVSGIETAAKSITNATTFNEKLLNKIGISVEKDNKLTLNEDSLKKADMNDVKAALSGNGSYAYQTAVGASMMNYAAQNEAAKANTYTNSAWYTNNFNVGTIFNKDI